MQQQVSCRLNQHPCWPCQRICIAWNSSPVFWQISGESRQAKEAAETAQAAQTAAGQRWQAREQEWQSRLTQYHRCWPQQDRPIRYMHACSLVGGLAPAPQPVQVGWGSVYPYGAAWLQVEEEVPYSSQLTFVQPGTAGSDALQDPSGPQDPHM